MTIQEIKNAVDAGLRVKWANDGYDVVKDSIGQYLIIYRPTSYAIGLTNRAGNKLNGAAYQFYIA